MGVGRHNHHTTIYRCVPNNRLAIFLLAWSSANLRHISLSSRSTRHFPLPHHAPTFSRIYPPGGQGRHIWQIVRQPPRHHHPPANNSSTTSHKMRRSVSASPFPHPQSLPFCKSQLRSPTHNLAIPLPHRLYRPISWQ